MRAEGRFLTSELSIFVVFDFFSIVLCDDIARSSFAHIPQFLSRTSKESAGSTLEIVVSELVNCGGCAFASGYRESWDTRVACMLRAHVLILRGEFCMSDLHVGLNLVLTA